MDFERGQDQGTDQGLLGWISLFAGIFALASHMLCCYVGALSLLITVLLTGVCLGAGIIGYRRASHEGEQHVLSTIGLVLGGLNVLVLTMVSLMQCYFVSMIVAVILMDQ